MLHTFTINGEDVTKEFILRELKARDITEVDGVKPQDGQAPKINVEDWLNKKHGKSAESGQEYERNHIWLLFYLTIII